MRKSAFVYAKTRAQISCVADQCLPFLLNRCNNPASSKIGNFNFLAIFYDCAVWFASDLIGNLQNCCFPVGAHKYMLIKAKNSTALIKA